MPGLLAAAGFVAVYPGGGVLDAGRVRATATRGAGGWAVGLSVGGAERWRMHTDTGRDARLVVGLARAWADLLGGPARLYAARPGAAAG